ncbi:Predicted Zn-dependent protease or its inactivated homolog [Nocardioides scoriae]|uniref:Predicted Zn-dependent protease or its inactivated homolog n=1 Tax=Nocardioides scoriae TaxID=642780 RepID=A0A1H1L389_9ACTN|nr:metallopeptidase TldD-related protein [Nocardioides scoriae]SDR68742.1 Predicted Zn-dependent protease or its inactivated homolog [Nocardioides scoriae]
MSTPQEDLATAAVEAVGRALPGADVTVEADRHEVALTRFAGSVIHQNVAEDVTTVRVLVHHEGRTAAGSASVVGAGDLDRLVERVAASTRVAPADPSWPGLLAPVDPAHATPPDEATAHASPTDRAEVVRAFVDGAAGLETAGYCRTTHRHSALASSAGQLVSGRAAECGLAGVARAEATEGRADGVARAMPLRLADLDGTALGARAAAKARAWAEPVELEPGRYEVVLEPDAVSDLLTNLAFGAFNGKAVNERRSFVRVGASQFDPAVTVVDDPLAVGVGYDSQGTPRQRLVLVEDGVTRHVTHDRRTAAEAGTTSTGHDAENRFGTGPSARHLGIVPTDGFDAVADEADGPAADASVAALVAGVERGLLVTDFWYTRVLDPRTLSITGLTRNGVWLVEDGRVTRPVKNFRFTQAYEQALAPGNVRAVGRTATPIPGDTYTATSPRFSCPALHLASWNFTGGASG